MGNISSSLDEHPTLYIKNPDRFQLLEIIVSNSAHEPYITFPASSDRIAAIPNTIDLLEFTQDPEFQSISPNKFLLKLSKDKRLELKFKFRIGGIATRNAELKGLTFINAANEKELARILTVEFNDDPNLHKHPNVDLLGNFVSDGTQPDLIEWTWKWEPPHLMDEDHHGWRNHCCFAEYDKKEHNFQVLSSFTFWVAENINRFSNHRHSRSASSVDGFTSFITLHSAFSSPQSAFSSPSIPKNLRPSSPDPNFPPLTLNASYANSTTSSLASNGGRRLSDDSTYQHEPEDGPLFRATLSFYEKKTGPLKHHIKRVLKTASAAHAAMMDSIEADEDFLNSLREAAAVHPQAFLPVLENYLEEAAKKIGSLKENMANQMQALLLEPLRKLYENDIKVADTKRKEFEDESRDYYQFLSKYLSLKVDTAKEKKKLESDSKYQNKRKMFELKRFDYYAYMQDLHGGRKDQEILYHFTNFAEKQYFCYLQTASGIQTLKPGLEKLALNVAEAAKEIHLMRKEREERRRMLETRAIMMNPFPSEPFHEGDNLTLSNGSNSIGDNGSDIADNSLTPVGSPIIPHNKFKGIRDMENHDTETASLAGRKKEGFLFATSRVTQHGGVDPLAKTTWHKYWCVLAGGQLCEYSNWKKQLETHNEPINLRFATVREARGADRRFCFEVITPQYRRIYQATSAEDVNSWMTVISNAIESLLNGTSSCRNLDRLVDSNNHSAGVGEPSKKQNAIRRRGTFSSLADKRRAPQDGGDFDLAVKIYDIIKKADISNSACADCGARKTEWCSINLGAILCIECSGIHRSLGTHISKIRSLTLDTNSYTRDLVEQIKLIGNARSNAIWEAKLGSPEAKLEPIDARQTSQEIKLILSETHFSQEHFKNNAPIPPPKIGASGALKSEDKTLISTSPDPDWVDIINIVPSSSLGASIYTKKLPPVPKPSSTDSRAMKQKYITAKYVDRAFVNFSLVDDNITATDLLFEAVKANDVPGAMQAIALKADVNAARRFEVEEDYRLKTPLILALLHIQNPTKSDDGEKQLFPMAELLLQNGALVERSLFDDLEDVLAVGTHPLKRTSLSKSVGAWAAEVMGDLKGQEKTILDIIKASGNEAAIKYLIPKALARGASPTAPSMNGSVGSTQTTSTGGVVGGSAIERKSTQNLGRSLSMSVRNAL
ncbi:hypothetical protein G9A89_020023 [Geosiphon pyriformis]|nr:hypothetical protein G9A89_020023 [Geosiphon pyriformis]